MILLYIMSGFCKAELTVLTVTPSRGGSETASGLLKDTQHICQCNARTGLQISGFFIMCFFYFVIICETVFNCYLSLGTSPSPHSPWKKVQWCSLISLVAFHLFQVLIALPIMQRSKQMLDYLSWPFAISESSKTGGFVIFP